MSEILVGLISGFIFGLGLCLSGLADPSVVQSFLDVAGAWNPALLFVMGAGLTVTLLDPDPARFVHDALRYGVGTASHCRTPARANSRPTTLGTATI